MTKYAQLFCTVNDLLTDPEPPAGDVTILFDEIKAASKTILQEIGNFIPVLETRLFNGRGRVLLFVPALLDVVSIKNEGKTLATTDYLLEPSGRHWFYGPYTRLSVAPDGTLLSWDDDAAGVELAAHWGLYDETGSTGATLAAAQSDTTTGSLQVSNGALISPGLAALIGTEQQLVTGYGSPTASVTTLSADMAKDDEYVTLHNGALVYKGEIVRIGVEQLRVIDINANLVAVQRGWNGTARVAHKEDDAVDAYRTFTVERGVNGTTAAIHSQGVAIDRYLVPGDVLFLCKEIATLMVKKASGSYAGRSGNTELGQSFYNDAFPNYDIQRVRDHYAAGLKV